MASIAAGATSTAATAVATAAPAEAPGEAPAAKAAPFDATTKKVVQKIPLLKTRAGPRDGDKWTQRLKEEYQALIRYARATLLPTTELCTRAAAAAAGQAALLPPLGKPLCSCGVGWV